MDSDRFDRLTRLCASGLGRHAQFGLAAAASRGDDPTGVAVAANYSDDTTVFFKIEKTCNLSVQEAVSCTVSCHP